MSEQAISAISIIPLVLGSILMLAAGFGFLSNHVIFAGVVCFIVSVLINRIPKKKT